GLPEPPRRGPHRRRGQRPRSLAGRPHAALPGAPSGSGKELARPVLAMSGLLSRPRLLITVRHPGPADFVLTALPELSRLADVTGLATHARPRLLLDRGPGIIAAPHEQLAPPRP